MAGRTPRARAGADGPQTVSAQKALVRLVHAMDLQDGDRLPTQQELRGLLGFSNDSLSAAMTRLVNAGLLERQRRVGTTVADRSAVPAGLWRIGIMSTPPWQPRVAPFDSQLLHYLQAHIGQRLCAPCIYFHAAGRRAADPDDWCPDFPGLAADIRSGVVDGLIFRFSFETTNNPKIWDLDIPVCHAGSWETARCGVIVDYKALVVQGIAELRRQGCTSPALIGSTPPTDDHRLFWDGFVEATGAEAERFFYGGDGPEGGRDVANQLLALPPGRRPDGLMVTDDRVTTGLCAALVEASDYRPVIASHANLQAELEFSLPVTRLCVDIDALASKAVDMVLARILEPTIPDKLVCLPPELDSPAPGEAQSLTHASEHPKARSTSL